MKFSTTFAVCLFAFASSAHADPSTAAPSAMPPSGEPASVTATSSDASEPRLSINPNLAGLLVGNYGGNVEYLFPGGHGLLVEGSYWAQSGSQSSLSGGAATIGYRWHWRGRQNSGFLGINASASIASGNATVTDSSGNAMTYGASIRQLSLTGNIGKRWMIGPANITFRIGAGCASRNVSVTSSSDPSGARAAYHRLCSRRSPTVEPSAFTEGSCDAPIRLPRQLGTIDALRVDSEQQFPEIYTAS